jgi:hypothetical protein
VSWRHADILKRTTYQGFTSFRQSLAIEVPFPSSGKDKPQLNLRVVLHKEVTWHASSYSTRRNQGLFNPHCIHPLRMNYDGTAVVQIFKSTACELRIQGTTDQRFFPNVLFISDVHHFHEADRCNGNAFDMYSKGIGSNLEQVTGHSWFSSANKTCYKFLLTNH